jgi:hypothetical protein
MWINAHANHAKSPEPRSIIGGNPSADLSVEALPQLSAFAAKFL